MLSLARQSRNNKGRKNKKTYKESSLVKPIPKRDFELLRDMGKLKFSNPKGDSNCYIANKTHSGAKTYYVQEDLLRFLNPKN